MRYIQVIQKLDFGSYHTSTLWSEGTSTELGLRNVYDTSQGICNKIQRIIKQEGKNKLPHRHLQEGMEVHPLAASKQTPPIQGHQDSKML